ncbi:hypothetical protein NLN91_17575, partial [Citrobacter portucalensis]|uniref:hypothetical protein n=1 Tax=Citrobacter portucalensis TaxID=1639133 RepID=UPI00226B44FB
HNIWINKRTINHHAINYLCFILCLVYHAVVLVFVFDDNATRALVTPATLPSSIMSEIKKVY